MDHLYFVVHTHWDREWYQPFQRMRARLVAMTDEMLAMVERGDLERFHFDGQTIVLEDYLEIRPENERRLRALISAGKIQVGPWYVLADSFLVSGESLIRNLEIGAAVARRFAEPLALGYIPDQFGHIAQMPQILTGFGFGAAVLWRGPGREIDRNRFIWSAPDGTSIFTVYLPSGYSNGANLPLDSADRLLERARQIVARERAFAGDTPILVMNGTDHTHPDPRLARRVAEARDDAIGMEIGTLEDYVERFGQAPRDGLPHHQGELRSPARAHLLPGVTSARTWIKQRDFENCHMLERIADPLAAILSARGYGPDLASYLELAWRLEIQNHPHDSICGCSIDQVHQDMAYRFDQAAIVTRTAVREAAEALFEPARATAPAIAVMNGSFATQALVRAEAEIDDLSEGYEAIADDGRRFPTVLDVIRPERVFELEIGAAEFKAMVAAMEMDRPVLVGRALNGFALARSEDGGVRVELRLSRTPLKHPDVEEMRRAVGAIPDDARVRIRSVHAPRCTLSFVADGLAQAGVTLYALARREPAASPAAKTDGAAIANEHYRIAPSVRGFRIEDLARAQEFELHFEDEGDRGDEYNFDPVAGAPAIAAPASVAVTAIEDGPVRKRLSLALEYELPSALTPDRRARSANTERMRIDLTAALYAGLARIDFEAVVGNRVRDHRLRVALATPIPAVESIADTSFAILRRSMAPTEPPGTEDIYPTAPHRSFIAVSGPDLGAALVGRGLYEGEARARSGGSSILMTLLRCVGWLSRSDLATRRGGAGPEMETPGAQEQGEHRFEFAVTTWAGGHPSASMVQRAQAYAWPPQAFTARAGLDTAAMRVAGCDNPSIVFSTARAAKRGAWRARVWNASEKSEVARFGFGPGRRVRLIDLAGRAQPGRTRRLRGGLRLEMRPFEIATFEVRAEKNFSSDDKKD